MSAINEYLKRLASIFGSMGFSVPPDDFSGVVIDGKTYPVMMRNDGCYVYFDDKGVKRLVSEVPKRTISSLTSRTPVCRSSTNAIVLRVVR